MSAIVGFSGRPLIFLNQMQGFTGHMHQQHYGADTVFSISGQAQGTHADIPLGMPGFLIPAGRLYALHEIIDCNVLLVHYCVHGPCDTMERRRKVWSGCCFAGRLAHQKTHHEAQPSSHPSQAFGLHQQVPKMSQPQLPRHHSPETLLLMLWTQLPQGAQQQGGSQHRC